MNVHECTVKECDFVIVHAELNSFSTKSKTFSVSEPLTAILGTKEEDQDEGLPAASQEHSNNSGFFQLTKIYTDYLATKRYDKHGNGSP